jgi:hypothetical protein
MKAHILTGSKSEIAEFVERLQGEIREAIVLIPLTSEEDIFAEMEPFTVKEGGVDCSRGSLYTRMESE